MKNEQNTILHVQGMSCPSCVRHINSALIELGGVGKVDVQLREGVVTVQHDAAQTTVASLIEKLESEGYVSKQRV